MAAADWEDPDTWRVGDTIDAETWTTRVYEPLSLLLRRPLTVVRRTTDKSIALSSTVITMDWDTVDVDDDGMIVDDITAGNITDFVAQRDGVYAVYFAVTWESASHSGVDANIIYLYINSVQQCRREGPLMTGGTTGDNWRAIVTDINLAEGDVITFRVQNTDSTSACNIKAEFNAPRALMFWKRPLGS